MKRLIYFFSVIILLSCEKKERKKDNVLNTDKTDSINYEIKQKQEYRNNASFWDTTINTQDIKNQIDGVTTGFLSKKDVQLFPRRKEDKYYGFYTLLKNDNKGIPSIRVGKMIIYDSINPYKYEKNTDEFVEITLRKEGVSLLKGKLQIGMSIEEVQKTFGEYNKEFNDRNIVVYKKENKVAVLNFENNILIKIKIGVYKKNIDLKEVIN
ncbi:hypothetical protein [Tenacibaculum maritimum]|uniref:Lipoprotein n=7 Tax=Tenacibaculum maritimum TaxID=107401 RepID=A0A2H1E8M0_9FLAO|nr:hypothetical protein [Tenacibaculum maritimum]MCD9610144.1 hypothetical protein [Tenacibaculum maritimum]CAA0144668.1 hypothetical protein TM902_180017 [Tenacibaculum maritimum]CAA0170703.1 hypothetical protein JIP32914_140057 [Tenacibaculum maritimum]CAA0204095.1 hypothetical protein UCDSB2_240049 [Tenacibaculum maritimum]CAA0229191.1 hypothetical protein JIP1097_480004 [Tenacibaculum maritimum]